MVSILRAMNMVRDWINTIFSTLRALVQSRLVAVIQTLLTDPLNGKTLDFIWQHGSELAQFIVDLIEAAKSRTPPTLPHGSTPENGFVDVNDNELNFSRPENRDAIICQVQRIIKSLIYMAAPLRGENITDFQMTQATRVQTDVADGSRDTYYEATQNAPRAPHADHEYWLFVNGVAVEYKWLELNCHRIARHFSRDITGIYNQTEGILWDLVECGFQRINPSTIMPASGEAAQQSLETRLRSALNSDKRKVVVLAHSQGCLILRLVLQALAEEENCLALTQERLYVFTFGNPSLVWEDVSEVAKYTEHFANATDFVAKLGILNPDSRYGNDPIFKNDNWRGHLFGSQYSLNPAHYQENSDRQSLLLHSAP